MHRSRSVSLRSGSARSGSLGTRRAPVDDETTTNMKVFVRVRPLIDGEEGGEDPMRAIKLLPDGSSIYIRDRFVDEKVLTFNKVFGPNTRQGDVFAQVGLPACEAALSGQYGTVLAYGQTGTGKTFTAFNTEHGKEGLMVRCVRQVFELIEHDPHDWEIEVQYLQIYKEQITDLLATEQSAVSIREDNESGVYVTGVRNIAVHTPAQVLRHFEEGNRNRVVRLTTMNAQSSRSHALFRLNLRRKAKDGNILNGRLTLVDLAGSERIKRTKADSLRRQEAQAINMSLSCLGTVIHALTDSKATHVPYRSCKLTRILRDSLGEHGKASIVVTISPALADVAETLGSLYFGTRALCVKQSQKIHYTFDEETLTDELKQQVTSLTEGKLNLESQVATLAADNTHLREAVDADETLIDELTTQIKCATKHKTKLKDMDTELQKFRDREKVIEAVMEDELKKQSDDYERKMHEMQESFELQLSDEKERLVKMHEHEVCSMKLVVEQVEDESRERISSLERELTKYKWGGYQAPSVASRETTSTETANTEDAEEIDSLKRQHSEEVETLRVSLDVHRLKLEEAQVMLRMCKQERETSLGSSRATSPPTPLPCMYASKEDMQYRYGSISPPARDHVEATLQSMQEQLDEERSSSVRFREEAERLKKEKAMIEERFMSLQACVQENSRMRSEKKEDRELLCSLIKERNELKIQIRNAHSLSQSPQADVVDRVSLRIQELARGRQRSESTESTNTEREPILGTFAVHTADDRELQRSRTPSSAPSIDRLFSRTMLRNM